MECSRGRAILIFTSKAAVWVNLVAGALQAVARRPPTTVWTTALGLTAGPSRRGHSAVGRMFEVTLSLSAVAPVFNVESRLTSILTQLIDVLPDLTPQWSLLIVDDGSTDATSEVAYDFARHYPQVDLVH